MRSTLLWAGLLLVSSVFGAGGTGVSCAVLGQIMAFSEVVKLGGTIGVGAENGRTILSHPEYRPTYLRLLELNHWLKGEEARRLAERLALELETETQLQGIILVYPPRERIQIIANLLGVSIPPGIHAVLADGLPHARPPARFHGPLTFTTRHFAEFILEKKWKGPIQELAKTIRLRFQSHGGHSGLSVFQIGEIIKTALMEDTKKLAAHFPARDLNEVEYRDLVIQMVPRARMARDKYGPLFVKVVEDYFDFKRPLPLTATDVLKGFQDSFNRQRNEFVNHALQEISKAQMSQPVVPVTMEPPPTATRIPLVQKGGMTREERMAKHAEERIKRLAEQAVIRREELLGRVPARQEPVPVPVRVEVVIPDLEELIGKHALTHQHALELLDFLDWLEKNNKPVYDLITGVLVRLEAGEPLTRFPRTIQKLNSGDLHEIRGNNQYRLFLRFGGGTFTLVCAGDVKSSGGEQQRMIEQALKDLERYRH